MILDYDCVRDVMLSIEALEQGQYLNDTNSSVFPLLKEYPADKIAYTVERLVEAGYIPNKRITTPPYSRAHFEIDSLTWEGHQYLDCIRNDDVWDKTRKKVSPLGGLPFSIMAEIAKGFIRIKLKELGIDY